MRKGMQRRSGIRDPHVGEDLLGPLFGVAPTGKRIEYAGLALFHIRDGRIASGFVLGDLNGLMRQLGLDTMSAQRQPYEGISE